MDIKIICQDCVNEADIALCDADLKNRIEQAYEDGKAEGYDEGYSEGQAEAAEKE